MVMERRAVLADITFDGRDPGRCLSRFRAPVQIGNRRCETASQIVAEFTAISDPVERSVFVETDHFKSPFDRLAVAAEGKTAVGFARDRNDPAIKLRREA